MKLKSARLYPINLSAQGLPTNLCKNMTPDGKFQIVRVLKAGGPEEGDFEILYEGDEHGANDFSQKQVAKDFPGLLP